MSIYTRDNLAASIAPGLASALDRAAAYRARQNARIADSFKAVTDFAPVLGRTIEQGFTPDKYKDDNDYRAARYDYILNGDRSGLDAFRQREAQAAESEKQRAFQASEAALNRALQESEGNKNRELQRQQHALEKTTEKARLLRDYRDAVAVLQDMTVDRKSKYNDVDRAKAQNSLKLTSDLLKNSGQFTQAEMEKLGIVEPPKPTVIPFKRGYVPEAQPAQAPAQESQAPAPAPVDDSWDKFNARFGEIPVANREQLDALAAELAKYDKDHGNPVEYEKWKQEIVKRDKELKAAAAAKQKASAKNESAKQMLDSGLITKNEIRAALDMGQKGGGKTEGSIEKSWTYNGKTESMKIDVKRNGLNTKLYVDGTYVGDVGLGF
jgi:hypothetical protein